MPVLPVVVPGALVSPGASSWSFAYAPAFMVMAGLVLEILDGSDTSGEVKVQAPAVFKVTLSVCVPATRAVFAGRAALVSVLVSRTVSVALTTFQFVSTALT